MLLTPTHPSNMELLSLPSCSAHNHTNAFKAGVIEPATDNDAFFLGDMTEDLLELFPDERFVMLSPPHGHGYPRQAPGSASAGCTMRLTVTPPTSWTAPRQPAKAPSKPPVKRRRRNRKRTEKQKELENAKRKANQDKSRARRTECLKQERHLRQHVRAWIHAYADFLGVQVNHSLLRMLPIELQLIVARADAALLAYRSFSGQATLRKELNMLPSCW